MIIRILMSCLTLHMCMQPLFAQLPERWTDCEEIWLPEKAIEDILTKHTISNYPRFSGPVQAIAICDEELYVLSFHGKLNKPKIKKKGKKKKLIRPLILNLKYFREGQYDDTRFFISYENPDRMLLEMDYKRGMRIDSIYFIKSLGPYAFEKPYTTYYSVLLSGDYRTSINGIGTNVKFKLNGQIEGHPEWITYKAGTVSFSPPGIHYEDYRILEFTTKDNNKVQRLAFRYDDNTKVWEGFEYEITEKYRKFIPSKEPVVILERRTSNNGEIIR
ncbi:hypothetical protein [Parapedobacter sp.]